MIGLLLECKIRDRRVKDLDGVRRQRKLKNNNQGWCKKPEGSGTLGAFLSIGFLGGLVFILLGGVSRVSRRKMQVR